MTSIHTPLGRLIESIANLEKLDALQLFAALNTFVEGVSALRRYQSADDANEELRRFHAQQSARARRAAASKDHDDAKLFLTILAYQIQRDLPLDPASRKFLSDALVKAVNDPKKAGNALGLVPLRRRPPSTEDRDLEIAFQILVLSASHSINLTAADSAISIAAKEHRVSESVAERAWKKYGRFARDWQVVLQSPRDPGK